MEALNIVSLEEFKLFLIIFVRISVVLFLFPIFGTQMLPVLAKAGFCLVISILLYPVVSVDVSVFPSNIVELLILLLSEILIGLSLALSMRIFLGAVQLAGQIIGFQMGFSMINVMDPQMGTNASIMEQIGYWITILLFLTLNGHHVLIVGLADSYRIVNVGFFMMNKGLLNYIIALSVDMFVLGIKIGAPAIAALLFTSVAFGITAKFAPTMNVMIVAFPVKIVVGLVLFGFSLQIILIVTQSYIGKFYTILSTLLVRAGGG